jgi:hypothetical protein
VVVFHRGILELCNLLWIHYSKAHHGALEAHPVALEAHLGSVEAHSGALDAHLVPWRLTCEPSDMDPKYPIFNICNKAGDTSRTFSFYMKQGKKLVLAKILLDTVRQFSHKVHLPYNFHTKIPKEVPVMG